MADPVIDALQADGTLSVIHALEAERDRLQRQLDVAMAVVRAVATPQTMGGMSVTPREYAEWLYESISGRTFSDSPDLDIREQWVRIYEGAIGAAVRDEREACAQTVERTYGALVHPEGIAARIRARGER